MLELKKDFFARLVISAHRKRHLNKPFHVSHVDFEEYQRQLERSRQMALNVKKTPFEEKVYAVSDERNAGRKHNISNPNHKRIFPVEKIDEKVEKIISNPILVEVQLELEFAQELLKKIKLVDSYNPKIPLIERTVFRLKELLEQKMYT